VNLLKKLCRLWWYHRHRWQQLAWLMYDAGMLEPPGAAAPPPFPRPVMPRWLRTDEVLRG